MGALVVCVIVLGAGGAGGAMLGWHLTRHLAASGRERIARSTVALLAGASGALIAAQLDLLVRQLEADAGVPAEVGTFADALNTFAVGEAIHGVLLDAGVLIGLATIVGALATRQQRAWSADGSVSQRP
jgi:hypothetical protein